MEDQQIPEKFQDQLQAQAQGQVQVQAQAQGQFQVQAQAQGAVSGSAESSSINVQNIPSELPRGSELILLVDNEAEITSVYSSWLEDLGYRTAVFSNSKEALRRFSAAPDTWDLLITDLHMPEFQGDELARRFHEIRPHLPVIICSGFSYSGLTAADGHTEFQTFVYKPVIKRDLATTVRRMLDRASS